MRERIADILRTIPDPTVIELGAHRGNDTVWLRSLCSGAPKYLAVEADPRHYPLLRQIWGFQMVEAAIASYTGMITLHLSDNDVGVVPASSSIRQPLLHQEHWPWCRFDQTIEVPCITLDKLAGRELPIGPIHLLWADIQGAERDMIEGGRKTLARTHWLYMEAYECEMYEGQAVRSELLAMLPGFQLVMQDAENVLLEHV